MSHFQLCKQSDGLAAITDIAVLFDNTQADPFPVTYQPWTDVPADDNLGRPIRAGLPLARWHYDWLSQPDVDVLLDLEGPVYVRTEKRIGRIRAFAIFAADLVVTDIGEPLLSEGGTSFLPQRRGPIEIEYRNGVEQ